MGIWELDRVSLRTMASGSGRPVRGPHPRDITSQTRTPAGPGRHLVTMRGARLHVGFDDTLQRRELRHPPAFLVASVRRAHIASGPSEVMMKELDQGSPESGRQAERDVGRGQPTRLGRQSFSNLSSVGGSKIWRA